MTYGFLDLAFDVLKKAPTPLTYQEIWDAGKSSGLTAKLKTAGKTPWQSIGAYLYVDVRDNPNSRFVKVGKRPARFFLKERAAEITPESVKKIEEEGEKQKPTSSGQYREKDLHPLLTYFAYANPGFNRGRSVYTKTMLHEGSAKGGYNEWVHPDRVGFYLPIEDWHTDVFKFNRLADNNLLRLFSFELKRSLGKSTYREAYFQAVSNSSWAHEGYLVAAEILQDDDFLAEMERLVTSFGIGLIQIDLEDIGSSRVLYPARVRQSLDWETINKLCELNPDFRGFIQNISVAVESKRIFKAEYEAVPPDPQKYIAEKMKVHVAGG